MKKRKDRKNSTLDILKQYASEGNSRNFSLIPAMKYVGNVKPSRSDVVDGIRRRRDREVKPFKSFDNVDWNANYIGLTDFNQGLDVGGLDYELDFEL